jgi:hypothetical protein
MLSGWLQDLERGSPAEWRGDIWLVKPSPLAASVEACGGALSISDRSNATGDRAIEGTGASGRSVSDPVPLSLDVSHALSEMSMVRVRCNCIALRVVRYDFGAVLRWRMSMARRRNGGSHDGLYAARMYRHDRRRLLRRLR